MFQKIKNYINSLFVLASPRPSANLVLYLVVAPIIISSILVQELGRKQ